MPPSLISFLVLNRQGTRIGIWTWRMLGGLFVLLPLLSYLAALLDAAMSDTLKMLLLVANNCSVFLNRFDRSGPLKLSEATSLARSLRNPAWHKDINGD